MKSLLQLLLAALFLGTAVAGDAPRGFMESDEFAEAQEKARKTKKLIAVAVKGDDGCPRCAAAMENGTKAIKSDCVMVFMRVPQARSGEEIPASVHEQVKNSPGGASVTFYVFDPELETLIATAGRKELEADRDATKAFKEKVDEARDELKG
jgi:hypothetical protein